MENNVTETTEEKLSIKDIERLTNVIHNESYKKQLDEQYKGLQKGAEELKSTIKGLSSEKDFIEEKLKDYSSSQLEKLLKDSNNINKFFVNPETGEELEMAVPFESKDRELEFKKGLLMYLKNTQETFDKIDEEYDKLNKATEEFNQDINEACYSLSDNVLSYISIMTDRANELEDEYLKKKLLKTLKYIKSGYDMSIYNEVIEDHPSVATKCIDELNKEPIIKKVGERYLRKLKSNNIKVSLIPYVSDIDSGRKSFEEIMLIRGDQYVVPDLFVYSLIRFFSMADWSDGNIRKAHASIGLTIKKMLADEFDDDVKKDVIDSIVAYLAKFPTE